MCVPCSTISPFCITTIKSAFCIVDSLCAITIDVLFFIMFSRASCTKRSLSVSRAEVASSNIIIGGFLSTARAILKRCFCPPESLFPESPILVSMPCGNSFTNSQALAIFKASITSSFVASSFPNKTLFLIVSLNKIES